VVLGKSRAAESDGSLSIVAMMSPYRATTQPRSGGLHFDVFASDIKAMGRLLIAAFLMLVAGDNAIAGDQGPAFQLQINPSNEPSQSLMLACSGLLTITGGPKSGKSAVSNVSVILYSNSDNVFSSLFDVGLPVTRLEGDSLLFARTWENQSIKYRADGAIDINGRDAVFNEIFVLNDVVTISFWYLHCKEGAVPPPVDLTPARPPLIVPMTPPS
jgi:hypothetical protein